VSVSRDNNTILAGSGKAFETVSDAEWKAHLAHLPAHFAKRLEFMTRSHRAVREFAVRELPRENGRTIRADRVAATLGLPLPRVVNILDDLERHLFFLVRDSRGDIAWAFPVSAERTPHQLKFNRREWTYGACAEDAFATPFVEGRLRGERLSAELTTECGHCGQALHISIDSELNWQIRERYADPLLFEPEIDWATFKGANIINDY